MNKYLSATRYCEADAETIKEKAEELKGRNDEETAKNTFYFVRDEIEYDIRHKMQGAERTLENSKGMCFDKTSLFIALLRANRIPARYKQLKCDLKVKKDNLPEEAIHLIAELNINDGWIVQDPSFDVKINKLIETSEWDKKTWKDIKSEKVYESIPFYLPYLINILVIPLSPKMKKIQSAIDDLRSENKFVTRT